MASRSGRGGMMINLPVPEGAEPMSTRLPAPSSTLQPPSHRSASRMGENTSSPTRRPSVFRYTNDNGDRLGSSTRYDPAFGNLAISSFDDRDERSNFGRSVRDDRYLRSTESAPRVSPRERGSGGGGGAGGGSRGNSRSPREEGNNWSGRTPLHPVDQTVVVSPQTDDEQQFAPRSTRARSRREVAEPTGSPTRSRSNLGASFRDRASNAVESPTMRSAAASEAGFAPRVVTPGKRRGGAASVASSVSAANRVQPYDGPNHVRQDTQAFQEDRYAVTVTAPQPNPNQGRQPQADATYGGRQRAETAPPVATAPRPVIPPLQRVDSRRHLTAGGNTPSSARPEAAAPYHSNSPRNTPSTPIGGGMGNDGLDREFLKERLTATTRELGNMGQKLRKREAEILKLRAALHRVHDAAARAGANVPHLDDSTLLPGAPPPHAAGLTLLPVPLALRRPVIQQHGYMDVLDVESRIFTSRKWKRRYVVADDRGVYCFRTEEDFATNAYHKVKEVMLYRQCEHFVPNIANTLDRLPQDDSLSDAERRLMLHPAASETNRLYFGFITRQPPGLPTSDPINPPLMLRTESIQEHEDWVHFLARMFNTQLYRDAFPQLFGRLDASDDDAMQDNPITENERQAPLPNTPSPEERHEAAAAAATEAAANPDADSDDDTVRDLGPTASASDLSTTPMPPRNPPPADALSALRPNAATTDDAESQTDITVSRRRGEQLRVLGRHSLVDAAVGDGQIEEDDSDSESAVIPRVAVLAATSRRNVDSRSPIRDDDVAAAIASVGTSIPPPPPRDVINGETQSDVVLSPQVLASLGGFETVEALVSALQHSAPPRRFSSPNAGLTRPGSDTEPPRGKSPIRRRTDTDNRDESNDVFTVASLQAEMLSLRHDLEANEATRNAQQEAITALNALVRNLEEDLAHLRTDLSAAEDSVKGLTEVNELAEKDLERLRAALAQSRRAGSVESAVTPRSTTPPPPPPPPPPANRLGGELQQRKHPLHSGLRHARMLAQGSRRRRQYADGWSDERSTTQRHKYFSAPRGAVEDDDDAEDLDQRSEGSWTGSEESYTEGSEGTQEGGLGAMSSDLEDLEFECNDCREMYRELTRVVDERDGLMREMARRHHEYTDGIAQMCERVIDDMDHLYERYREEQMSLIANGIGTGNGDGVAGFLPLSMLRIDASPSSLGEDGGDVPYRPGGASTSAGFSVTCAVDEKRVRLLGSRADKKRPGSALPSTYSWRLEDLATGSVMSLSVDVAPKAVGLSKRIVNSATSRYGYTGGANLHGTASRGKAVNTGGPKLVLRGPQVDVVVPPRGFASSDRRTAVIPHALSPS